WLARATAPVRRDRAGSRLRIRRGRKRARGRRAPRARAVRFPLGCASMSRPPVPFLAHDLFRKPVPTVRDHALVALGQFDLFRPGGLDPGATSLFDVSAYAHAAALQPLGLEAGVGEGGFVAFRDGDSEVLLPPPPEIDVDRGAAFADREHFAFHDGKPT